MTKPLCAWHFQEPAGSPRASQGQYDYTLQEMAGPVERVGDGVLGPYAAELREGQWFNIPRAQCPALNFHGPDAKFSIVAWVRRQPKTYGECQAIAGMWNETDETRQYCMFLDLKIWDSGEQVCGHLSATGAPSPGYKYCMESAIGATPVPMEGWHQMVFTYDGVWARVYLDGKFDPRPGLNPYFWRCPINTRGEDGSDFTVGAVYRNGEIGNWYVGALGGLSVYDCALTEQEIAALYSAKTV